MGGTRLVAGTCGLMQVAIGLLYLGPSQLVRRPLPPDQISFVVYIEQAGPYWVVGFVLSGLVLVAAAVRGKGFVVGYAAGVFVWLFYGGAILLGALVSEPPTPVLTGTFACFLAFVHAGLAFGCAERGYR